MTEEASGTIIYLNGTSSAGKTTIAAALQLALPAPYLLVGLDNFSQWLPTRYVAVQSLDLPIPSLAREGLAFRSARHNDTLTLEITLGPAGRRYMRGFRQMIRALALAGNNVIVDDVLYDPAFLSECVSILAGLPICFVGVVCDPVETARRERARGDRLIGQAAWQAPRIHVGAEYDLVVDTTHTTPEVCAGQIAALVNNLPRLNAFERMYQSLAHGDDTSSRLTKEQ